jgi:hypothetical protein
MRFLDKLKRLVGVEPGSGRDGDGESRRRDPPFGSGPKDKDVDKLPPERAAELAGHAPERVDT